MKITLLIIILVFTTFVFTSFFMMFKKNNNIIRMNSAIDFMLSKRFKKIESIISEMQNPACFEETSIGEMVSLRSQALKFKKEGDIRAEHLCENKISHLLSAVNILIDESPTLRDINNKKEIIEEIQKMETHLRELKSKYNRLVERYNIEKSNAINMLLIKFFPKLDIDHIEWE